MPLCPPDEPSAPALPASATDARVAWIGLLAFVAAVIFVCWARPFGERVVPGALALIACTAFAIVAADVGWQKVHRRPGTGLDFSRDAPSWARCGVKLLGLAGSMGFIGLLYWGLPEYHGTFYSRYFEMLQLLVPAWLLLAVPYVRFVDRRMTAPRDGYWHMGRLLQLAWRDVDGALLRQHLLGWLIKGYFLPLMFTYLCNDLGRLMHTDFGRPGFIEGWFDFLYDDFYFIDVALVSMGYLLSLRLFDTHLRSAEPTALGWMVALVCYEPFWSLVGRQYLAYENGGNWVAWLGSQPLLYGIWGVAILALTAIYVWATVSFGARFSNLTHRGIITSGPYRWTKHPAYLAKNLSWWMISVPFLVHGSVLESLRHCLLLLALNGIYLARAWTEERHLGRDPEYLRYAQWIERNGIFSRWRPLRQGPLARRA